ncbi:hypothetical protein PPROV_000403800 [Pycnococcus provasolii]|uniref:YlxR domain-containing protein n=1 Tax=Pycnococcus provasolii TaxID=41880 RepID=A0A830HD41_9CHLO|nr:hypothetical protein PPROV_000403800 [Pycnococcus provasolii]
MASPSCVAPAKARASRALAMGGSARKPKDRSGYTKAQVREKHLRACASCRRLRPQSELLRVVRVPVDVEQRDGDAQAKRKFRAVVDVHHVARHADVDESTDGARRPRLPRKLEGRSVYVCRDTSCISTLCKTKGSAGKERSKLLAMLARGGVQLVDRQSVEPELIQALEESDVEPDMSPSP